MSDLDSRFRDAVHAERKRVADEAASTAATERVQAQIAARLSEFTAPFREREGCRYLVPTLTQSEHGLFGITFRPTDEAMAIRARLQDRLRAQQRFVPEPQPILLRIGTFANLADVSSQPVLEQLARSFVFHEKSIQALRTTFSRLEQDLQEGEGAIDVDPGSRWLIYACLGVLVALLLLNLAL